MKKITTILMGAMIMLLTLSVTAQDKPSSPKSEVNGTVGNAKVKINYCQPSARGRKIMGGLVPYGEVWRTGANEATTIEFDKAVKVEGKDLPAGKYALFTIPSENEWTIIFNKDNKQWGAYKYKQTDDVLRVNVKPTKTDQFVETFTITPEKNQVSLKWENTAVAFKVK
ncbi:DUF2911 domain-containing protein [Chryseosolibacter indicus]|uniref:DUF2911 domain-containing protein n=1 Tax=Chryseosolibacter indicus TaxID=2782351 RepID=A0ABS5VRR7_9BACT|nr:DUF2911 domain-containing protein [Chryseosolibacter indicus]MBT1703520.1 DUF2911 domain-containing protein [Chryseosolibacter indicus]